MKKYKITVNGKTYEVEVEELGASTTQTISSTPSVQPKVEPKPQQSAPKVKSAPKKEVQAKPVPQGAETVEAPMPGTVVDIKVSEGDTVSEGQVLVILEAMKMENEIVAPRGGKVAAINASKGASVNAGDPLVSLE
ncbi:biotin/lipoyl-containing protein [Caldisalinibacter kiritimatiensis]|uniref:Biotin/lipoyl attachment protein n=1 Tax=Caldisalinibacter kiritimatiensis TaxID=1304284 RepID=R1CR27_9FIRM|nr:biotin/lipoyl-containing protein [Caldisalinibacter kiritimatiensis]EOD01126.1 biotin/lipoyl attachment protein [Caldisalinibacter kiritimatiensis]